MTREANDSDAVLKVFDAYFRSQQKSPAAGLLRDLGKRKGGADRGTREQRRLGQRVSSTAGERIDEARCGKMFGQSVLPVAFLLILRIDRRRNNGSSCARGPTPRPWQTEQPPRAATRIRPARLSAAANPAPAKTSIATASLMFARRVSAMPRASMRTTKSESVPCYRAYMNWLNAILLNAVFRGPAGPSRTVLGR